MINQRLQKYIEDYSFCSEYIFKDWESFLDIVYSEGERISSILWWDYCTESQHIESVGGGGYRDPENNDYIYAETQLFEDGLETKTLDEIKEYINQKRKTGIQYGDQYRSHNLVPSFYLTDR